MTSARKIVIVAGDQSLSRHLRELCCGWSFEASCYPSGRLQELGQVCSAVAILFPPGPGEMPIALDIIRQIRSRAADTPIVFIPPHSSEDLAIGAFRAGATEYFKPPLAPGELRQALDGYSLASDGIAQESHAAGTILGQSTAMRALKDYLERIARTDSSVLITGETGTGKELAAEMIHNASSRASRPMVTINCAAIPDALVESELFGYERGAFTGATSTRDGKLKYADGGTVFLDEIGDMGLYAQAKILRVIDSRKVCRVGGTREVPVNVRYIAATNHNIEQLTTAGSFRADLYFRLNIARVHLPSLRERMQDVPELLWHYLQHCNERCAKRVEGFTQEAQEALMRYHWPGNVRELMNVLEGAFINVQGRQITLEHLPERLIHRIADETQSGPPERDQLLSVLFAAGWNKSQAAQQLHWSRMTLYRKMAKYEISTRKGADSATRKGANPATCAAAS